MGGIYRKIVLRTALSIIALLVVVVIGAGLRAGARADNAKLRQEDRALYQAQTLLATLVDARYGPQTSARDELGERREVAARAATLAATLGSSGARDTIARAMLEQARSLAVDPRALANGPSGAMRASFARPIARLQETIFAGEVQIDRRLAAQRKARAFSDLIMLGFAAGLASVILVLNLRFVRDLVSRLAHLTDSAERMASGRALGDVLEGDDEITALDRTIHATARSIAERELRLRRYELLASAAQDFIFFIRRKDGLILDVNHAAIAEYGYSHEELTRMQIADVRAPETLGDIEKRVAEIDTGFLVFETIHKRKDGTTFPVEVSSTITLFEDEVVIVSVVRNITERKRAESLEAHRIALELEIRERSVVEDRLAHAAFHDTLTGLPNRALFSDRMAQAVARQARHAGEDTAVLFLDLDRFKDVNDTLGHENGDALLVEITRRLVRLMRDGETLARFGGDEFAYLIERLDGEASAIALAERVLGTFVSPFVLAGRNVFVTASIGVAIGRDGTKTEQELLHDADVAMYSAKKCGRNRYAIFASGAGVG